MAIMAVWLKVDEERIVQALQEAGERLDSSEGEVVLDFSSVLRIDASGLRAMEEFAGTADDKGVEGRVARRQRRSLQSAQAGEAGIAIFFRELRDP